MLTDPIDDLISFDSLDFPTTSSISLPYDFLSSPTYAPPPADIPSIPIDLSVVLIGKMTMLIEQPARIVAEITQLRATIDRHTTKFTTLRSAVGYLQRGLRWICRHWDDGAAFDEEIDIDGVDDASQLVGYLLSFCDKKWEIVFIFYDSLFFMMDQKFLDVYDQFDLT